MEEDYSYENSPFNLEKFKRKNMPKNKFTQKQAIDLIKSGSFTIAYHDNGYCCLYEGKYEYEDLKEDSEVYTFEQNYIGYIPEEVALLTNVLKGKCETV